MKLRVLVTGGAGFIGSHLVDRLMGLGHSVRFLIRKCYCNFFWSCSVCNTTRVKLEASGSFKKSNLMQLPSCLMSGDAGFNTFRDIYHALILHLILKTKATMLHILAHFPLSPLRLHSYIPRSIMSLTSFIPLAHHLFILVIHVDRVTLTSLNTLLFIDTQGCHSSSRCVILLNHPMHADWHFHKPVSLQANVLDLRGARSMVHTHLFIHLSDGHVWFQVIVADNFFTGSKDNVKQWMGHPDFEIIRHGDVIWHHKEVILTCDALFTPNHLL